MHFKRGKSRFSAISLTPKSRKAQITLFIIIAIFIVASTILFFVFRGYFGGIQIPSNLQPVYDSFLDCLNEEIAVGIDVLESQGGYIYLPDFEPGSKYMPFSSQLDFAGSAIPYWYYVSGNNIQKEQVPSKNKMENDLEAFIETELIDCNFDRFYDDGFEIIFGESEVKSKILDDKVEVSLNLDFGIKKADETVVVSNHEIEVESELGKLYDSAKEVYKHEQNTLFLENYGVDILRLYAPVDGVELSCSPLTWNAEDVFEDLKVAIESNVLALNVVEDNDKYFELDLPVSQDVRFINSRNWPNGFEVNPTEGSMMIASTVGNQPGLGALGFCYVPYHFVYNVRYPVLAQVSGKSETFQFPFAVVLQGNMPREALEGSTVELELVPLCDQQNVPVKVNVYDTNLDSVDAEISYKCANTRCEVGETEYGFVDGEFPQCVNGFLIAKADGYVTKSELLTVVDPTEIDVILDKLYELDLDLKLGGKDYDGQATITFISEEGSKTVVYPEQTTIELSEGQYEIKAYVYRESSIKIAETTTRKCMDVPQTGLGGFFGFTKEQCFNFDFPEQILSNVLAGGGTQNHYILESDLSESSVIEIEARSLPVPKTIQQVQDNYLLFEDKSLGVSFR